MPSSVWPPSRSLDDDPRKHGLRLNNVPVLGDLSALSRVSHRIGATEVVIAMPTAPAARSARWCARPARRARHAHGARALRDPLGREARQRAAPDRDSGSAAARADRRPISSRSRSLVARRTCWSRAPADRSAASSAGRSRGWSRRGSSRSAAARTRSSSILQELRRSFPDVAVQPGDRRRPRSQRGWQQVIRARIGRTRSSTRRRTSTCR